MTGGLIQLITIGKQDSPLIANPEITFFKTVYKQYTLFSLCQNNRYIGSLNFNKEATKIIEKNGDLLYNQYFKIEIPYFDIIKKITKTQDYYTGYNINQLEITYANSYCLVIYTDNNWYIVPEHLFKLSFNKILYEIDSHSLEPNLLPEYITVNDLGRFVYWYQIKENSKSSIIDILRVSSNYWEQLWLNIISSTNDIIFLNKLLTIKSDYTNVFNLVKYRIFNLFWEKEFTKKNNNYFDFSYPINKIGNYQLDTVKKSETERYYEYINSLTEAINNTDTITLFDIDIVYQYCINNNLDFNNYRDYTLPYNSLMIYLILNMLYSDRSLIYTFWKKYELVENNQVNTSINNNNTNFDNEWNLNLDSYMNNIFKTSVINNPIYEEYKRIYLLTEKEINKLIANISFNDTEKIYIKLKTILGRFYQIPYRQLNFNDYYLATNYPNNILINYYNDNYYYLENAETIKYKSLINFFDQLDLNEMNNITPVDLINVYALIANSLIELIFTQVDIRRSIKSFLVFWKNNIMNRLYKRYLDTYYLTQKNAELYDFSGNRRLTFYYSIFPSNLMTFDDFKNSFYEIFFKNSWIGNYTINDTNFIKFKENIHSVNIDAYANGVQYQDKNFNKLEITNTYYYTYGETLDNQDIYNKYSIKKIFYQNNTLYIKYDNYYDKNNIITLQNINNSISNLTFTNVQYQIITNERNINSLYLAFSGLDEPSQLDQIILTVTYINYIPAITFYKSDINYPNLQTDKYYIYSKKLAINNIINNQIFISPNYDMSYSSILVIKYFNPSKLIEPDNIDLSIIENGNVSIGNHLYAITYYNSDGESIISNPSEINVLTNNNVKIILPTIYNVSIIGRKIYKTKANEYKFYLLANITDNNQTYFIDNNSDETLLIDYNINNNIKYKVLDTNPETVQKIEVRFSLENNLYNVYYNKYDEVGFTSLYQFPQNLDNIKEIYIETINLLYQTVDYNINSNGKIELNETYSPDYLYYYTEKTNIKDNIKLLPDKLNTPFRTPIFTFTTLNTGNNYNYHYKIAFYNTISGLESLMSDYISISTNLEISNLNPINISNLSPIIDNKYNSWKIFRTKNNSFNKYYLITISTLSEVLDNYNDNSLNNLMTKNKLILTRSTNYYINKPFDTPILQSLNNGSLNKGIYKYSYTFADLDNESYISPILQVNINNTSSINIQISISDNNNVTRRKIYRTLANQNTFYLLAIIEDNITTTFNDNITDQELMINPNILIDDSIDKPLNTFTLTNQPATEKLINYRIRYYNTTTLSESIMSDSKSIYVDGDLWSVSISNFPELIYYDYDKIKIYRDNINGYLNDEYYLIGIINSDQTTFIDNNEIFLRDTIIDIDPLLTQPDPLIINNINNPNGIQYQYKIALYQNNQISELSDPTTINTFDTSIELINFPSIGADKIIIYRNKVTSLNDMDFKIIKVVDIGIISYIDNLIIGDIKGEIGYRLPINLSQDYQIIKVPLNNLCPNLSPFISHSTDINYINNKNISDFNDYLFNKPFIMLVNNGDKSTDFTNIYEIVKLFNNNYLYFYNINFKINANSLIKLNDADINYLLPLSEQQFFIKDNELYYDINLTSESINLIEDYELIQKTFTPSYDDFDITPTFFDDNYYADIFIDNLIAKIEPTINNNPDYKIIIELLSKVNDLYLNIFDNFLKNNTLLYGQTSNTIINNLDELNKINSFLNNQMVNYNISNYLNIDYFNYTHMAINFAQDETYIKLGDTINLISPIYKNYNSSNKLSDNLKEYLLNVSLFFIEHLKYINNNIDYLDISNPNNYEEEFLSYNEIQEHKINNFYNLSSTNIITLLHPSIEDKYTKAIINNTIINDITINNNQLITDKYTEQKPENDYYNTDIKLINRNEFQQDKFNYIGLINVDTNNEVIYNDSYLFNNLSEDTIFKFDDDNIYTASIIDGRYNINLEDRIIINPYTVSFNEPELYTLSKVPEEYLYKIRIDYLPSLNLILVEDLNIIGTIGEYYQYDNRLYLCIDNYSFELITFGYYNFNDTHYKILSNGELLQINMTLNNSGITNFIINNKIINGYYQVILNVLYLYIKSSNLLSFDSNTLIYQATFNDLMNDWEISYGISKYIILAFMKFNYYSNTVIDNNINYYSYNNTYQNIRNIINVSIDIPEIDGNYFYINSTEDLLDIDLYTANFTLNPSMIIKDNIIYSYQNSKKLKEFPDNNYILLVDRERHFILRISDIKENQIPNSNYHCWLYPNNVLPVIEYELESTFNNLGTVNITPNIIPTFSFYKFISNSEVIYYYENDNTILASDDIEYYKIRNDNLDKIYLIDNNLFNNETKQLIKLYQKYEIKEDFISKKLIISQTEKEINNEDIIFNLANFNLYNKDDYLYLSNYVLNTFTINNYNNNEIQLSLSENETLINSILLGSIEENTTKIYYPLILSPTTTINFNLTFSYTIDTNTIIKNGSFICILMDELFSGILDSNMIIGEINTISNDYSFYSYSPNLLIDNKTVSLKEGYTINNVNFGLDLWKIGWINNETKSTGHFYIWTLLTINNDYNILYNQMIGIYEPYNISSNIIPNFLSNYELYISYPEILEKDATDLIINQSIKRRELSYKYYIDTRHYDINLFNHGVKQLEFNQILNIKPNVEYLGSTFNSTLDIIYYIIVSDNEIKLIFDTISLQNLNSSIYFSIEEPIFINNPIIIIPKIYPYYEIVNYRYSYLEMGEIIMINDAYYYVEGLNVYTNNYDLRLISGENALSNFNGYYTFGNYMRKNNKIIPELKQNNIMEYYQEKEITRGTLYYQNNILSLSETSNVINNVNIFREPSIKIKLFLLKDNINRLFLFDNYLKLNHFDIILDNNESYQIINIRNGEIFLDREYNSDLNNTFIEFTLVYQPFKIKYVEFNNGKIINENIKDNQTVIINNFDLYQVKNNTININLNGYYFIRIWESDYLSFYENYQSVPKVLNKDMIFSNKHPIELNTIYNNNYFEIETNYNYIDSFTFYYLQPVKLLGTYSYIYNFSYNNNKLRVYINVDLDISNGQKVKIIFSPNYYNLIEYYSQLKFKYNHGFFDNDYYNLEGKKIKVIRYSIKNNKVILVDNSLVFDYGISIAENEAKYNITYPSIYFYNNKMLNSDGTINNTDILIGSYHLLSNNDIVRLIRIDYPNKIRIMNDSNYVSEVNNYFIDKTINIVINIFNRTSPKNTCDYTLNSLKLYQANRLPEINNNIITLIKTYEIKLIGIPTIINGEYKQMIEFITTPIDTNIYDTVYLDDTLINSCQIIYQNNNYYLVSDKYLSNDVKIIYSKIINYFNSHYENKDKKSLQLSDTRLEEYINDDYPIYELLTQELELSKISQDELLYNFRVSDNINFTFMDNKTYRIDKPNQKYLYYNNDNKTIQLSDPIDNDLSELSSDYITINLWLYNEINKDNLFNQIRLFSDVKQLNYYLLFNSVVSEDNIYNYLKPWKSWSLLNSINKVDKLAELVKRGYLIWNNNKVEFIESNDGYLTFNEIDKLTIFLECMNNETFNDNYQEMITIIEPKILSNLKIWLDNPNFFLDVTTNINNYLVANNFNVIFDGYNLIFNNETPQYIIINKEREIANYITNEYIYDNINKKVYRPFNNYSEIDNQINKWINKNENDNKTFGVSIHQLLRYLRVIGDELKELINYMILPLVDTPEYIYNNPLKFIINKLWEKYNQTDYLKKLDKEFSDKLEMQFNFNTIKLYSSSNFLSNFTILYTGVYNLLNFNPLLYDKTIELNINNLIEYQPNIYYPNDTNMQLITKPLFPYIINFQTNEITPDTSYIIDFLNGTQIAKDITLGDSEIYSDQLRFYSEYNIKPNDFIIIKKNRDYQIVNTVLLGYLYELTFSNTINVDYIDTIYYRNYNLTILSKDTSLQVVIPLIDNELDIIISQADLFELRNITSIKSLELNNNKLYLDFYNYNFNFIENQTYIKTPNNLYLLYSDIDGYYITADRIETLDITIITILLADSINDLEQILYRYTLLPNITDLNYNFENNNIILPLEFKIVSNDGQKTISPSKVSTLGNGELLLFYTKVDNDIIIDNIWTTIRQSKRLGQQIINKVVELIGNEEYLYYFNFILPRTLNTLIYIYETGDIDINNGEYIPLNIDYESINFYQKDNRSYFILNSNYKTTLSNYNFIQKNTWDINDIVIGDRITIKAPDDFILIVSDKYYYKFNEQVIDKNDIIYSNNYLSFSLTFDQNNNTLLEQYYIETDNNILIPELNKKYTVSLDYHYQYNSEEKFYIVPYTSGGNEFDEHLYLLKTFETTEIIGFREKYSESYIYLYNNGIKYNGKILDEYHDQNIYYLISLKETLDTELTYTYHLEDNIIKNALSISFYQESLNFCEYYQQNNLDSIDVFMGDNINDYIVVDSLLNPKPNKFYFISYLEYEIINEFNENKFIQSEIMKSSSITTTTIETNIIKPEWEDFSRLFSYIRLYFNDQLIEEINEDVFKIDNYLYSSDERKRQLDNMTRIRLNNNKWELYIPLIFWFAGKAGLSIPTVALPYTEIRLKYKLNDISYALKSDLLNTTFSKVPIIKIDLITDFILLDTLERKLFGSLSHEYIIDKYRILPIKNLTETNQVINKHLSGLVKDIHLITTLAEHPKDNYYSEIINKYDSRYNRYTKALDYYNQYITNNIYTSIEQKEYSIDIQIIGAINRRYSNYITQDLLKNSSAENENIDNLINIFGNYNILESQEELIKFLLYYQDKFMSEANKTNYYIIDTYLRYLFSNKKVINEISPIEALTIKVNGAELFSERDDNYYNSVIPNQKFNNSLPTGYYSYTFSLYPRDEQFSGHLNFTYFDDIVFKFRMSSLIKDESIRLKTVIREYNILRIMSGMSSLGWMS